MTATLTVAEAAANLAADFGSPPPPADDPDCGSPRWREWFREYYRLRGRPVCRKCGGLMERGEEGPIHAGWCWSCELAWCESRVLVPLAGALGRRGALHALTELVRRAKSM
jgi:hypothetical protein